MPETAGFFSGAHLQDVGEIGGDSGCGASNTVIDADRGQGRKHALAGSCVGIDWIRSSPLERAS